MADASPDLVTVQLTEAGAALAGGGTLYVSSAGRSFAFQPGATLQVERTFDWIGILRGYSTPEGSPLCELRPQPDPDPLSVPKETL